MDTPLENRTEAIQRKEKQKCVRTNQEEKKKILNVPSLGTRCPKLLLSDKLLQHVWYPALGRRLCPLLVGRVRVVLSCGELDATVSPFGLWLTVLLLCIISPVVFRAVLLLLLLFVGV